MLDVINRIKEVITAHPIWAKCNDKYFYIGILAFLLLMVYQIFEQNLIDTFLRQDNLNQSNTQYLEKLRNHLSEEYVLISEVHALLTTIESGSVGISIIVDANIQIGKEVKSLTTLAEDGKQYLEASVIATESIILLLYLSHYLLPVLFQISLVLTVLFCAAKWLKRLNVPHVLFRLLKGSILLLSILHFALPYSVHLAKVSTEYLDNHYDSAMHTYAKRIHEEYVGQSKTNGNDARAKSLMEQNETITTNTSDRISSFFRYTNQKLLRTLLTNTVIPTLLFLSLYLLFRFFIESTFQIPEEMAVKTRQDKPVV
ncbi:MAG: hypothetical protein ACFHVJ_08475 [Aestuariibacter sp.]